MILVVYWSFTTLSTVGFGDYNPRSDPERILCSMVFLGGVSIFSIIMSSLIEMLEDFLTFQADLGDGDLLNKFIGCMKYYNGNKSLNKKLIDKIEQFFDHKWNTDKLGALNDDHG